MLGPNASRNPNASRKPPSINQHNSALRASKAAFAGVDTQIQILYSLVDQRLFGPQPLPGGHNPLSSDFLGAVQRQVTSLPHAEGSLWHARFGHLTGYGAGYYGYLYDRCVLVVVDDSLRLVYEVAW